MKYINIHTHRLPLHREDCIILNEIISKTIQEDDAVNQEENTFRSYGIHPWYMDQAAEQLERLKTLAQLPHVVAIGEAGLDRLAGTSFSLQEEMFRAQIDLSESLQKPLIIHCVKAWAELIALKKQLKPAMSWVVHGFRGNGILAKQLIAQGFYLSFGDRFNPESVHIAWPEHLLVETDDREVDIREVYHRLAASLLLNEDVFAAQIVKNAACFSFTY